MRRTRWRWALALVCTLGVAETLATWRMTQAHVAPADWQAAQTELTKLDATWPIWVAPDFLGDVARTYVPALGARATVGLPDVRDVATFAVLSLADSDPLATHAWAGVAGLRVRTARALGSLVLTVYDQPAASVRVADAGSTTWTVTMNGERCRPGQGGVVARCAKGQVIDRLIEVNFVPRRCLALTVEDNARVTLAADAYAYGDMLDIWVGSGDFNARLRNDAPVRVTLHTPSDDAHTFVVTDEQGWMHVEQQTGREPGPLSLDIALAEQGTWQGTAYNPTVRRTTCVWVRSRMTRQAHAT